MLTGSTVACSHLSVHGVRDAADVTAEVITSVEYSQVFTVLHGTVQDKRPASIDIVRY